jgi:hypothetical protein
MGFLFCAAALIPASDKGHPMTAIPASLTAETTDDAIQLTLQRLQCRELTPTETEKDLLLLFDAEMGEHLKPELTRYISDLAEQVRTGALDPDDAASDIRQMIGFWLARSEDLPDLLVLAEE